MNTYRTSTMIQIQSLADSSEAPSSQPILPRQLKDIFILTFITIVHCFSAFTNECIFYQLCKHPLNLKFYFTYYRTYINGIIL